MAEPEGDPLSDMREPDTRRAAVAYRWRSGLAQWEEKDEQDEKANKVDLVRGRLDLSFL